MPDEPAELETSEDRLLGGAVRLLQPRRGHRAGTDAMLLANVAALGERDLVVDLGAGSGAVGLTVAARREGARLIFVERDPALAGLCRLNAALNGCADRSIVAEIDVFAADRLALAATPVGFGKADLVVTNPPFFQAGERPSPEALRRSAHRMEGGDLTGWLAMAAEWLRHRGRLGLIHRADHLDVCLAALAPRFGSVAVRPVHPRVAEPATRILISAVKGGRSPLRIEAPLVLHGDDGAFTPESARLHAAPAP